MRNYIEWTKLKFPTNFLRNNIFIITVTIILLHFLSTEVAKSAVYYLAVYVTDSIAPKYYIGTPYDYELIHWDEKLKKVTYGIYVAIFLFEIMVIHLISMKIIIKKIKLKPTIYIVTSIFILSFPTITSWHITSTVCKSSFYYCSKTLYIFTPIIMSNNPIWIFISLIFSLFILVIYFKYCRWLFTKTNS